MFKYLFSCLLKTKGREWDGDFVGMAQRLGEVLEIGSDAGDHPPSVQVEPNVEEWPIFQLGRSRANSVVVERNIEGEDGSSLRQRMEVSAPGKYKLPGRFDYDVYSAVLELLEIRGGMPESGYLGFSLHELILMMGLEPSGRTYGEVRRSLRRIAATVLESDNAFWSNGAHRHISDTFRLWDVSFDSIRDKNGSGARHQIEFGKLFKRSFAEQYLRGLDIDFFWELDSPVAKRLYRLVDLKRASSAFWQEDLFELQKYIPIGPYAYVSKIKEKLSAAHEELVGRNFLSEVSYEGKSLVVYALSEAFRTRREAVELAGTREEIIAIQLLTRSELRGDVARNLVAKHGPAHCTRYANALPYQKNLRNPAGWLRRAIEEGFELPHPPRDDRPDLRIPPPTEARALTVPSPWGTAVEAEPDAYNGGAQDTPVPDSVGGEERTAAATVKPPLPDPAAQAAWKLLIDELKALRRGDAFPPWFGEFEGSELEGATLLVLVPNSYAANHLNENFGADLVRLWRDRAGEEATLQVALGLSSPTRVPLGGYLDSDT